METLYYMQRPLPWYWKAQRWDVMQIGLIIDHDPNTYSQNSEILNKF
jgi:hypothetical protein